MQAEVSSDQEKVAHGEVDHYVEVHTGVTEQLILRRTCM